MRKFVRAQVALSLSSLLVATSYLLGLPAAHAFETFAIEIPCRSTAENDLGVERPCITCHDNADGGAGCETPPCFNPFGTAFRANGSAWDETLAALDSDGDGYTNGEELGDPSGTWRPGQPTPRVCECATRPGFNTFTPGDTDADDDGYCCRGEDLDDDGDCLDEGEHAGPFDCDDDDAAAFSAAEELCFNSDDNDCDGAPTLEDEDCADVVDGDGDGFCPMGRDNNRDGDCIDVGETTADVDCDDDEITVFPGAFENCRDTRDNDCSGLADAADPMCTTDIDADDDGYCPLGTDLNDDGDCNDAGEADAGLDCNDTDPLANPDQAEICDDGSDNDCDGTADFRDEADCAAFFDFDGDGYCAAGRDGNGDDDCVDEGETDEPGDCNDDDPSINPGAAEVCTNEAIDDDCDGDASLDDADCVTHLDIDGDRYCAAGFDRTMDGDCADADEELPLGDCDEENVDVNPTAIEMCTDGLDNECDGAADAADRGECSDYRDPDEDGFCLVGEDLDEDGDCDDEGEQLDRSELSIDEDTLHNRGTENDPTRYPDAPENCRDGLDNDLDGEIDESGSCTRETDADGDGWCPIGRDVNGDGDCLDEDENIGLSDCNDGDAEINPDAEERCRDNIDADCDGRWGTGDSDCFFLLDQDGDTFCPMGVDDNLDGDCLDASEDRGGMDCNDNDRNIGPRAREICDDNIDNDCDELIDLADTACPCESSEDCDDGDPCTTDMCERRRCMYVPNSTCGDAGVAADAGPGEDPDDCGCRAVGTQPEVPPLVWLALFGLGLVRLRRGGGRSRQR